MSQTQFPTERIEPVRRLALLVLREPFQRRTWAELAFFVSGSALSVAGAVFIGAVAFVGAVLLVVLVGIFVLALDLRAARGLGRWQRELAWRLLGEEVPEPEPFIARPGRFGWLRAALRDGPGWRSVLYFALRVPLTLFGLWFALSIWISAVSALLSPVTGTGTLASYGFLHHAAGVNGAGGPPAGFATHLGLFVTGALLLFLAPWTTRLVVFVDRRLMHALLGPDAAATRVRRLEESRSRTLDEATVTLRRIERDLHDGTQAQLVALAMRLGQAKEKLDRLDDAPGDDRGLDAVRRLVDDAHRGAKEAIVDLRDLARGIHPPALDTGLPNALATLAARSPLPTEVQITLESRPSRAIEAICYYCAAELLANVAQHAQASRASLSCAEHGRWLRLVVRDDGRGGAAVNRIGSSSSGLAGLADRVRTVDGELSIASPPGGPTVVTVDLPVHA